MKKIVRLTENDLVHLVKRIINEQFMNYAQPKIIGQQVRFYKDEANTQPYFGGTIVEIFKEGWGLLLKVGDKNRNVYESPMYFKCSDNFLTSKNIKIYNKNLINDLKKIYCTTSSGGTPVTNIGRYSSVDSNKPTNIA